MHRICLFSYLTRPLIGHFRVPKILIFKTRLCTKPLQWNEFYMHENKNYFNINGLAISLALKQRHGVALKWSIVSSVSFAWLWYYGYAIILSGGVDPQDGRPLVRKEALCPFCQGDKAHAFSLESISQSTADEYVMCPNTKLLVDMRQIAPDVVMEDVGEQFRIEDSKLVLDIARSSKLGDGAFGAVYRALYDGKSVAAKVCK